MAKTRRYQVTLTIEVEDGPELEGRVLPVTKADLRREFRLANIDLCGANTISRT